MSNIRPLLPATLNRLDSLLTQEISIAIFNRVGDSPPHCQTITLQENFPFREVLDNVEFFGS